ncbi:DNA processing protein [Gammaproteobacteria bacterium]
MCFLARGDGHATRARSGATRRAFARELAATGLVITSGLAYGIDGAGHEGALDAAEGVTVAVAGTGLDQV